jgi:hypothetical protein
MNPKCLKAIETPWKNFCPTRSIKRTQGIGSSLLTIVEGLAKRSPRSPATNGAKTHQCLFNRPTTSMCSLSMYYRVSRNRLSIRPISLCRLGIISLVCSPTPNSINSSRKSRVKSHEILKMTLSLKFQKRFSFPNKKNQKSLKWGSQCQIKNNSNPKQLLWATLLNLFLR